MHILSAVMACTIDTPSRYKNQDFCLSYSELYCDKIVTIPFFVGQISVTDVFINLFTTINITYKSITTTLNENDNHNA